MWLGTDPGFAIASTVSCLFLSELGVCFCSTREVFEDSVSTPLLSYLSTNATVCGPGV